MVELGHGVRPSVALGPARDALYEAWLRGRSLFEPLLEFFPDTRNCEKLGWSCPLERLHKCALESIWPSEEKLTHVAHVLDHIEAEARDMRQGQVGDDSIVRAHRVGLLLLRGGEDYA